MTSLFHIRMLTSHFEMVLWWKHVQVLTEILPSSLYHSVLESGPIMVSKNLVHITNFFITPKIQSLVQKRKNFEPHWNAILNLHWNPKFGMQF